MSINTAKDLRDQVIEVMKGALIHNRPSWGPLMHHGHNYEGWWKAQIALAIENCSWSHTATGPIDTSFGVEPERKLKSVGLKDHGIQADLHVAPWDDDSDSFLKGGTPRIWIELKQRGTHWESPEKAYGTANHGIASDFQKWEKVDLAPDTDAVVFCQILTHVGTGDEDLKPGWSDKLEGLAEDFEYSLLDDLTVGYELPGEDCILWCSMYFFGE